MNFNAQQAQIERDKAIAAVQSGANPSTLNDLSDALINVSKKRRYFTTDDVWKEAVKNGVLVDAIAEKRVMGAVMAWGRKSFICTATKRHRQSIRVECHARPLRVWESLSKGVI